MSNKTKRTPTKEDAQETLKALDDMKIVLHELDWTQTAQALEIACKHNIALYDASYLFLTNKIKAHLITADNKLHEKAKDYFKIENIKDYK